MPVAKKSRRKAQTSITGATQPAAVANSAYHHATS
jgi:hypothetical protein